MRKTLIAVAAGLAVAGGAAALAGAAQAQPYGYYTPDGRYAYSYDAPRTYGWDGRYVSPAPGYYGSDPSLMGSVLGSVLGGYMTNVPYDRFGADPGTVRRAGPPGRHGRPAA